MSYTFITHTPGSSMKDYRAVQEAMGPGEIEGHLLSIAGDADGVLHTVDIWDSKESADRFTAERLFPVFEKLGYSPGPDATHIGFEDADVVITRALDAAR